MASKFPKPDDFAPEPLFPEGHRYAGKHRCQAWNRNEGRQCSNLPMTGKRVCKNHGGRSLSGADHPNYQGKGYSKALPKDLLGKHEAWLEDPGRNTVVHEMALARALVSGDLELLSKQKDAPDWAKARKLYGEARALINAGNTKRANKALGELGRTLAAGKEREEIQGRVMTNLETVRRLVDTQRQIEVDTGEFMRRGTVILVMAEIINELRTQLQGLPQGDGDRILMAVGQRVKVLLNAGE